jgi:hypothetical protein
MFNQNFSKLLNDIGDLLELNNDNVFRIRAFRRAAETIESLPNDFSQLDRAARLEIPGIGKETLVNGTMNKLSKQANANDPGLIQELNRVFGQESAQTLDDLKNQRPSTNVKYLLFSRLADFQPITISEMPEYYAKGGNARIFYMLKSYSLKQIDVFHNKVFMDMKKNPKKSIGNLVRLATALAAMNASADVIKKI